ncbi:hypothetical protein Pcinc_016522 [Petrolisthes cinctipes]|uniref:C2H2-type domain-containing protein n=1 Tax=Petrolisthes cinctipes TaxID=88211 RepID=A0AAE1FR11_PETCI|nr:hypothetical protein Pcinc_016522 [Petrolisthes cinctipes]
MNVNMWEQNLKCEFCDVTFDDQDALKKHLRLHSRRKPYKCDDCGAKFSYNSTLEWHKKSHTGELPFKCDECRAQFPQSSMLVWHKRKHRMGEQSSQGSPMIINMSNICHQQEMHNIPTLFSLPNVVNHQGTAIPISVVATCSTETTGTLSTPTTLHHMSCTVSPPQQQQHTVSMVTTQPGVTGEISTSGKWKVEGEEGMFRCDFCGAVLLHSADLRTHVHTKHNMGDNNPFHILAKQQQANGQFLLRKKIIVEKPFKCNLCGVGFNKEGHLKTHRQKHFVDMPFKCDRCGMSFCDAVVLESHARRHQVERPFKCDRCGAAFFRESHLQRHIKRHTGEHVS